MGAYEIKIGNRFKSVRIVNVSGQHGERMFRGIHGITFTIGTCLTPCEGPMSSLLGFALPRGVRVQIMQGNAAIVAFVAVQMSAITIIQQIVDHKLNGLILNVTTNIHCAQAWYLHQFPLQHIQILSPERECVNMFGIKRLYALLDVRQRSAKRRPRLIKLGDQQRVNTVGQGIHRMRNLIAETLAVSACHKPKIHLAQIFIEAAYSRYHPTQSGRSQS
mmetsp:Transcript_4665/g.10305  ORF Transcript_4665/g.10305 Transcript_4665/m.10305 type:complete len:219 (-) Transcript_4665:809-1465(-)